MLLVKEMITKVVSYLILQKNYLIKKLLDFKENYKLTRIKLKLITIT